MGADPVVKGRWDASKARGKVGWMRSEAALAVSRQCEGGQGPRNR